MPGAHWLSLALALMFMCAGCAVLAESRALQQATNNHEAAQARYDALSEAAAQTRGAQAELDLLRAGARDEALAAAAIVVTEAAATLEQAEADLANT